MIREEGDQTIISIGEDDLVKAIALLENMRDYCKTLVREQGQADTVEALTVAIEAMNALYCEHFGEDEKDDSEGCDQAAE